MEVPLVLVTRINLTSSRVRIDAEHAESLQTFLYKKKLAVSPVESRPQAVVRIVKNAKHSPEIKKEEYAAAFHVTATTDVLTDYLDEWTRSLAAPAADAA